MKAKELIGIIPPLLSSFTPDGDLYRKGLQEIIRFSISHINGYYPIGTYGCGPLMNIKERNEALDIILAEVNGRVPVVPHVGAADTRTTIELARYAKSAGASGVGAIAPYYAPHLPEENIFQHFADLIDAVNEEEFPVFLYNNGHYSQNPVSPKLLRRLAEHGLRGCKDSSFDLVNYYLFQDAVAGFPDFNLIVGTEAIFMGAFDAGATGTVCGMANIFPEVLEKLYRAYLAGNRQEAIKTQRLILRIRAVTKLGPTVPIMHAVLQMRGVDAGVSRKPLIEIDAPLRDQVQSELAALDLLK